MPTQTPEKVTIPAAGDTYAYLQEQRTMAATQRTIVQVDDRTEADQIATARATDNRPVTDEDPLVVWNTADKRIEVKTAAGWNDTGRMVRHMEFADGAGFDVAGGNVSWDIGPLPKDAAAQSGADFATQGPISGAITINETGWYGFSTLHMPNGNPGAFLVSLKVSGGIATTGESNGYAWEAVTTIPMIKINAGTEIRWTCTMQTSRKVFSRVRVTKWA